jgi:DNA-binding cell septation regulator SpoVG
MTTVTRMRIVSLDKIKAFADINFNGLKIHGLKVVDTNGLWVGYPREKGKDEKFYNVIEPDNIEIKNEIESAILKQYRIQKELENEVSI